MPRQPQVLVRDKETGAEYLVSEARYKRTPKLWDRIKPEPEKPKTSVSRETAKKATSGQKADSTKENS